MVVRLISHSSEGQSLPNSYWKYGPTPDNATPHWYDFEFDAESRTGAQIDGNTITLHFVDGARGDDDLTANGQIKDPGAPTIYQAPTAITLTQMDAQSSSNWLLIVSGLMTLLALGALRLRWQRG